ncbi:MAG TPA: phosphotransferase [Blastocatellia bacterium]|jgi:aminoglycoside/choline kinase family phosphotransferase|nr:phosphotransferase [Blastocatellia bacterium]
MTTQNIQPGVMTGQMAGMTGGLSEKRVINYASRYFAIPLDEVRFQALTPDASTRKYYRIFSSADSRETFIISLYMAPFNAHENSFVDVSRLFERAGLPVPRIIDVADTDGVILQEDLGDTSLATWLCEASERGDAKSAEAMMRQAIELIAQIQATTRTAYEMNSISCRLAFDEDKLSWELNYFFDHFFGSLMQRQFEAEEADAIKLDLQAIAAELAARPRALTHRDYHGMNLMVDTRGALRIIDHQDARMGPASYDLVPLLLERRLRPVDESWVEEHRRFFLSAGAKLGLPKIEPEELEYEFHLMTVQRQLKAIGTFSYQTAVVGRGEFYWKYIEPSIATVLRAMGRPGMKEYPALRRALETS